MNGQRRARLVRCGAGSIVLLLAASTFLGGADQIPNVCGYIVTRDGKTTTFTRVKEGYKRFGFRYGPEDKRTTIPLADVSRVTFGEKSMSAVILLKDGRKVDAKCCRARGGYPYWPSHYVELYYFDDIARKEGTSIAHFKNMSQLVIDEHVGRFRRCPHCKGTWPDSFLFCPHDGAKTVWGERSGSVTLGRAKPSRSSAQDRRRRDASVLEAVLNASLARSGVDPSSKEAKQAKDFGKLWMNPAADPKEIHRKLDELRREWRKKSGGE